MSVHIAITNHSRKQNQQIENFLLLEQQREQYIEQALTQCHNNEPFAIEEINQITQQINDLAKNGIIPTRKLVTKQMIIDYANKAK
jgi:hypothetical protein